MQKVLNQEEIDALFRRARGEKEKTAGERHISECDFRSAGQITKDQLRIITGLHETFARNLTHGLGAYLRVGVEVAVVSVEQLLYSEFLARLPELAYVATFKINELETTGALHLELPVIYPILDLLLGGRGRPEQNARELTELEQEILAGVLVMVVRELSACWEPMGLTFALDQRLSNEEVAGASSPFERVMTISFEVRLPEARAMLNVLFPVAVSGLLQRNLLKANTRRHSSSSAREQIRSRIMQSQFTLNLGLPSVSIPARQLSELRPGSVLMLPHKVQQSISLRVAGTPWFAAFPVARNDKRAGYINRIALVPKQDGSGEYVPE